MPRKLVYLVAVTLDGFIAGTDRGDPSGSDAFPVGPDTIEHLVAEYPETLPAAARAALGVDGPPKHFDTVLEGRASYEIGLAAGVPDAYPHLRHLVFSTTLTEAADPAIELRADDPATVARELKAQDGLDVWVVGGARLAHALLPEIDTLILKQQPTVLGAGVPLFDGPPTTVRFAPAGEDALESGVRVRRYDRV